MDQHPSVFLPKPLRLNVTRAHSCTYLSNRVERRLAANISSRPDLHDTLAQAGFRRVENWVYKPACQNCQACQPIRVVCSEFSQSRNMKRLAAKHADLTAAVLDGPLTDEHYDLFQRYLTSRHEDGQMGSMTIDEFSSMVENSPISTFLIDYRDTDNALLASVLVDLQSDGLSAVYSFFEPECPDRSFGSFIILDLIERVQQSEASYLYLGYYIAESRKMSYKARYTPFEIFHAGRWQPGSSLA